MTTKWDRENILYTKWLDGKNEGLAEGREEGLAEGREEGLAEGREEGLAEGREEGRTEMQRETVRNLKAIGASIETIMAATQLSKEEIEAL